jgi:hypothetical protein
MPSSRSSNITAAEWRFVWSIIAIVLVVTTLPYVYGYVSAPPDKQFMGIMLDVPDHGQYFSWMRELTYANLSANKLTPEPNKAIFFNLLWWGLGRLGQILGLGYAGVFQILRFVSALLFLLLVYRICAWHFEDALLRRTAFLIATFTSGLGWILIVLKYTVTQGELLWPLTVFIAEGNTFLGILGYPHFIGAALYILVFELVLRGQSKGQLRYAVVAGLIAQFFGWQHAYDLVLVYGIVFAYAALSLWRDRRLPWYLIHSGIIIALSSCWPALYAVLLTSLDPLWKEVLKQFANADVYTPKPWQLPILLGPAFILVVLTAFNTWLRNLRSRAAFRLQGVSDNDLFVWSWFLMSFPLAYLPTDFQIHMLNGWQVPIALLATQSLFRHVQPWLAQRLQTRTLAPHTVQRLVVMGMVLLILPTNVYLWAWRFVDLARHDYPYYLHKDEVAALHWLEANAKGDDVILSSLTIGQYIPAHTGAHAFLAHWAQTLDFYGKEELVKLFFNPNASEAQRLQLLRQYSVDYVFVGSAEQALGGYVPTDARWAREVFATPRVKVYAIRPLAVVLSEH